MNLEYFIAKRLIVSKSYKSSVSSPIIKIAILAIALSILMMVMSVATGIGLQQKIREKLSAFNGHVIVSNFDDNQSQVTAEPIDSRLLPVSQLKKNGFITHVQPIITKGALIRTETDVEGIIFKGVDASYQWKNLKEFLVEGKIPTYKEGDINEVLISQFLANRLKLKVGSSFNTFFMKTQGKLPSMRKFKIAGIYNSGFQEFDSSYIIGNIEHLQRINKWQPSQVGAYEIFIDDFSKLDERAKEIYKTIPPTFNSTSISEKYFSVFEWLKLFDFNILVILIIMIGVATINMVVALLVLILERTQLIGMLKALGANNWSVRKIFLYNAAHLISRGLLWGNGIAILLLVVQKKFEIIKLNPESYYVSSAPVDINLQHILLLNLGTILICVLVLLIPSYLITKISPIKALKFD
ncbi:ABC transporter permease [Flavobacterium sp. F372]|uniref:ABC transporter permease n=1 Tax=Flavobacterium bernardetii TaxID=2813823 RepID=A0ABR7J0M8_9FLAO|nr:FtsX-like permease family protein [Flavobacterium bernardetii]MBC5835503.1 ABC transporter permease [Flavobacterium bernardetii]NHF69846.1 ABC transporter permease [Flavobacterium bernardetii]